MNYVISTRGDGPNQSKMPSYSKVPHTQPARSEVRKQKRETSAESSLSRSMDLAKSSDFLYTRVLSKTGSSNVPPKCVLVVQNSRLIMHSPVDFRPKDTTADLLTEVCNDVRVDFNQLMARSCLLMLKSANAQDGARLDIAANGVWGGRFERTYFDVRVFNPHALSNRHPNCYTVHEMEKKRKYEQRTRLSHLL